MSDGVWNPDPIGYHRYEGVDLKTKHDWLKDGNSQGSQHVADALRRISARLTQSDENLRNATKDIGVEWTGQAASILGVSALRAANWTTSAGDLAGSSGSQIQQYGQSYEETKAKVPEPKPASYGFGDAMTEAANGMTFGVFDMQSDYQKTANENKAADDAANRALYAHESVARASYESIPAVDPTPDIAISAAPAETPTQPDTSSVVHHSTTGSRELSHTPQHNPGNGHVQQSNPPSGAAVAPPVMTTGPGVATTTSGYQVSPVGAEIGPEPARGFPSGGDRMGIGAPGLVVGGALSGGASGSGSSARGVVGGGSSQRPGRDNTPGRRAGEAESTRGGRAATGRAVGRADNGQIMQPVAGKGKKEGDQEHRDRFGRKSDDIFLAGIPTVTPPVIGENP